MQAELLIDERLVLDIGMFIEIVVWRVPKPLRGSTHHFKYRLAFIVDGNCVLPTTTRPGKVTTATSGKPRGVINLPIPKFF